MSNWIQNSNGNYVYVLDSDYVMTVYTKMGTDSVSMTGASPNAGSNILSRP
jgi:hypothetical protein